MPENSFQKHFHETAEDHASPLLDPPSNHVFWIRFQGKTVGVAAFRGEFHVGYLPMCCDVLPWLINRDLCGYTGQMLSQPEQFPANQRAPFTVPI